MAPPPSTAGAVHARLMLLSPSAVTVNPVGAPTVTAVTTVLPDFTPSPALLLALT